MLSIAVSSRTLAHCSLRRGGRGGLSACLPSLPAPHKDTFKQQQQQQLQHQPHSRRKMSVASGLVDRATLIQQQRDTFNAEGTVGVFMQPLPADIQQRLQRVAAAAPGLGPGSRVIDVGSGTGCLIPHIQARGVRDILAVDLAENMLQQLVKRHGCADPLGNEPGVRTWCGDVVDLPPYMGPVDAFFFNGVFGNLHSQREGLLRAALALRPGGHVVLSHVMGRRWHTGLRASDPVMVPHELPARPALEQLLAGLPLELADFVDEDDLYLATLRLPPGYAFAGSPLFLEGQVVTGFGRGSRQMGVPTANIDPAPLAEALRGLPQGVYFGWASVAAGADAPEADRAVHKMVMNYGQRPTVSAGAEGHNATVEVHILHKYSQDFYGKHVRVLALGFLRPEMRFAGGLPALIARIRTDIGISQGQLDEAAWASYKQDPRLLPS